MVKSHWHGALRSAHKSCAGDHVSLKRGGRKWELVAAPWTSSRSFSLVLWLKVYSHWLLRACLLGSKRKLPPLACQVLLGLPSVVCRPRGCSSLAPIHLQSGSFVKRLSPLHFLCTQCLQPLSRCCCCPLQCNRRCMETHLNSAGGSGMYHKSWSLSFLHYSQPFLLHCFFPSQEPPDTFLKRFSDDNKVIGREVLGTPERNSHDKASSTMMKSSRLSTEEHRPSHQTHHCTHHQHRHGLGHWHTSPGPVIQSISPHQDFSASTRWPSKALNQMPSTGLWKPCRVSCW